MRLLSFLVLTLAMIVATGIDAQSTVGVSSTSGTAGGTAQVATQLTTSGDAFGWSWGVCHDPGIEIDSVAQGADTAAINGGSGPDFYTATLFPGDGWTVGVVVSFFFDDVLSPGTDLEMDVATYSLTTEGSSAICFCNDLQPGVDPIETLVVIDADGNTEVPTQSCGAITIGERFTFDLLDATGSYDPGTGLGSVATTATIAEDNTAPGFPSSTAGFSMGLAHDNSLVTPSAVDPAQVLQDLDGGMGPDFFAPQFLPTGLTLGVVYDFFGTEFIQFTTPIEVISITYDTVPSAFIGDNDGETSNVSWNDALGNPITPNLVVLGDLSEFSPLFDDGTLTLLPGGAVELFVRGDFDGSGTLSLPDAISTLNFLFVPGSPMPTCADAIDFNDDGGQSLPDATGLLNWLFVPGSPMPSQPFPDCGVDPTDDDAFDCGSSAFCD